MEDDLLTRFAELNAKLDEILTHVRGSTALEEEMRPLLDMASKNPMLKMMMGKVKGGHNNLGRR